MIKTVAVWLLLLVLMAGLFALDVQIPLGMAGGVPYMAIVLLSLLLPERRHTMAAAMLCSLLTIAALALSWSNEDVLEAVLNRALSICGIWIAASLGIYFSSLKKELERSHQDLERRVQERSDDLLQATEELKAEIAERERAQQELLRSESYYLSLIENLSVHVFRKDLEGRFTFASHSFCQLLSRQLDEVLGKTDFDFFPRELAEKYRADDLQVIQHRRVFEDVEEHQRPSGGKLYVQVLKAPLYDADEAPIGIQGIFWDVTDRKLAEAQLRESDARKRAIFETAMDCIIFVDQEGRIVEFNRAAEITFQYERSEVLGQEMVEVMVSPASRARVRESLARYAGAGEVGLYLGKRVELQLIRKGGEQFIAEMATQPIPVQGNAGFAIFLRDITSRKQAEHELRRAKEAAEAASCAKSLFVANMSHEIRTPMNAIIGMTDLLLESQPDGEQREYLTIVQESAQSLLAVINDILDFSKMEAGRLDLENVDFSLRERLGDAVKSLAFRAHSKGLELACRIDPQVPDALAGDPIRLRQVIVNLVGNAIKFTRQGEVIVEVELQQQTDSQVVLHFAVSDTGIGIAEHKRLAIFDAFEQADNSTTRQFGGTGLGLSISSKLVDLMQGQIWVDSQLGCGSTFHFTTCFGLARQPLPDAASAPSGGELDRLPVLIVDDNAAQRRILAEMLRSWNMEPTTAGSLCDAREMLSQAAKAGEPFRVALIDATMPTGDGFALARQIVPDQTKPIMLLTSGDRANSALRGCRHKVLHLMKPVKQSELLDSILAALDMQQPAGDSDLALHTAEPPGQSHRRLHILLAEDSLVNQKLTRGLLEKRHHRVTIVNNGREAVEAVARHAFDLVLMDVQMPVMDGLAATAAIRQQERDSGRHVPIVAMTAHAMKGDRERCLESGMDGYIAKPIRARQLMETINAALDLAPPPACPTEHGENGSSTVDWSRALEVVQGDRELLGEVIRAFVSECPRLLGQLREALLSQDAVVLSRAAHTLKSSTRYLGADRASSCARALEELGRRGDLAAAPALVDQLEQEVTALLPTLRAYKVAGA